jgi:hypothetical protein
VCVNETSAPAGWYAVGDTCIDVELVCANATGINFYNAPLLCISGNKTNEITDLGLSGWTINLYEEGDTPGVDPPLDTDTTDAAGNYSFCGLEAGNYTVCEVVESGWIAVSPECVDVELVCANATVNFINTQPQQTCGTAVAAMYPAPGTPTPGVFWPLGTTQSNWFTYITYNKTGDGTETVYPIYYGQDQLAGWLYVRDNGTHVAVNFTLNETMGECDVAGISLYHVEVAPSLSALAGAVCNKGGEGNPVPGKCDYKGTVDPIDTTTGWIECDEDEDNISSWTDPIYIFAHAIACWYCP